VTAKEEVLETIRLWIAAKDEENPTWDDTSWLAGYGSALDELTELLDSL